MLTLMCHLGVSMLSWLATCDYRGALDDQQFNTHLSALSLSQIFWRHKHPKTYFSVVLSGTRTWLHDMLFSFLERTVFLFLFSCGLCWKGTITTMLVTSQRVNNHQLTDGNSKHVSLSSTSARAHDRFHCGVTEEQNTCPIAIRDATEQVRE